MRVILPLHRMIEVLLFKSWEEDQQIRLGARVKVSQWWSSCEPHWMIRGSAELLQASQSTFAEGLYSIDGQVTDIEIIGHVLVAVIDALIKRIVGYLSKLDDFPILLVHLLCGNSEVLLNSPSRKMALFWFFFKSFEHFFLR